MKKASKTPPLTPRQEALKNAIALAGDKNATEHIHVLARGLEALSETIDELKAELTHARANANAGRVR